MGCCYLEKKPEGFWCRKAYKWVDPDYNHCYTFPDKCGYVTDGKGEAGCFLTTACVDTMGLPDDCMELEAMCSLRDDYILKEVEDGDNIVKHYYTVAPEIVKTINEKDDHEQIWRALYEEEIVPCADLVCHKKEEAAFKKYSDMLEKLEKKYMVLV